MEINIGILTSLIIVNIIAWVFAIRKAIKSKNLKSAANQQQNFVN